MVKCAPFGQWDSPITTDVVTSGPVELIAGSELLLDRADTDTVSAYFLENVDGVGVVYSASTNPEISEISTCRQTPEGLSCRSTVHEYGGGCFCVSNGKICFSTGTGLFLKDSTSGKLSEIVSPKEKLRFADGDFGKIFKILARFQHGDVFLVQEDHRENDANPTNSIVRVELESGVITPAAFGSDFFGCPRVSHSGSKLVWMQWNHPNMPWDSIEIWLAQLDNTTGLPIEDTKRKLLGDGYTMFMKPTWSAGDRLFCISDQSNWMNVYEVDVESTGMKQCVHSITEDFGRTMGVLGAVTQYFDVDTKPGSERVAFAVKGNIFLKNMKTGVLKRLNTGYEFHTCVSFGNDNAIYCTAGGPTKLSAVIRIDIDSEKVSKIREISYSIHLDEGHLSSHVKHKFDSGTTAENFAHGFYYAPKNKDFTAPEGSLPPAILVAHGGPTGQASRSLSMIKQFFTSRGFAIFDVDYRGSTSYGRRYRDQLRGEWGVLDVEDICNAAKFLIKERLADPKKICIYGGSAGGYLVLRGIQQQGLFAAGICLCGVSEMWNLLVDTHKYESSYIETMIAPKDRRDIYRERSPIYRLDEISSPVIFFQGLDDRVVPPDQATTMFDAVKQKGFATALVEFEGEGHMFQKRDSWKQILDGSYYFLCRVLGIATDDEQTNKFKIENLKLQ